MELIPGLPGLVSYQLPTRDLRFCMEVYIDPPKKLGKMLQKHLILKNERLLATASLACYMYNLLFPLSLQSDRS